MKIVAIFYCSHREEEPISNTNSDAQNENNREESNKRKSIEIGPEQVFEAMGEDETTLDSAKKELVRMMEERIIPVNRRVLEYKIGRNFLSRKIWKNKTQASFQKMAEDSVESDASDYLTPFPKVPEVNRPRTRSMGKVEEYPNVMDLILERKNHRK